MPPARKFQKEDIVACAYDVVKRNGIEGLNARSVAKELKASVQPIFHNFQSMEELKSAVMSKICQTYKSYILKDASQEKGYKQIGLAYIRFAKEYPQFFRMLFMQEHDSGLENFIMEDAGGDDVIRAGQRMTGFSYEEQKGFHNKVWIFTHGIAALVATKTVDFTEEQIDELLEQTVFEMLIGTRHQKERNQHESCN